MLLVQGEDKLHHRRTAFRVHEGHSSGLYLKQMGQVQSLSATRRHAGRIIPECNRRTLVRMVDLLCDT